MSSLKLSLKLSSWLIHAMTYAELETFCKRSIAQFCETSNKIVFFISNNVTKIYFKTLLLYCDLSIC